MSCFHGGSVKDELRSAISAGRGRKEKSSFKKFAKIVSSYPRTYGFSGGVGEFPVRRNPDSKRSSSLKQESGSFDRAGPSLWEEYQVAAKRHRRPTILLIDPDQEKSRALSDNLQSDGYIAVIVKDPVEALRIARLLSLDLVICSLDLLGRDNGYFVRHLRKTPNHEDVPVILLSSHSIEDESAYVRLGADALCVEEEAQESVLALASFYLSA